MAYLSEATTLPSLQLPEGMTAESLSKVRLRGTDCLQVGRLPSLQVLSSVLIRKAYKSKSDLEKWLLLATLDILHGSSPPTLDPAMLMHLQPSPPHHQVSSHSTPPPQYLHQALPPHQVSSHSTPPPPLQYLHQPSQTNVDDDTLAEVKYEQNFEVDLNKNVLNESPITKCCPWDSIEDKVETKRMDVKSPKVLVKQESPQVVPEKADFTVQVTPKIMGRTCSKYIQVKKRTTNRRIQTNPSCFNSYTNFGSQTEPEAHIKRLFGGCADQEAQTLVKDIKDNSCQTLLKLQKDRSSQTLLKNQKDGSSQTLLKNQKEGSSQTLLRNQRDAETQTKSKKHKHHKPKWQMIPMSGLPRKRTWSGLFKNAEADNENLKYNNANKSTGERRDSNSNSLVNSASYLDSPQFLGNSKAAGSSDDEVRVLWFHGHPLIKSKDINSPLQIPLKASNKRKHLVDPRLAV